MVSPVQAYFYCRVCSGNGKRPLVDDENGPIFEIWAGAGAGGYNGWLRWSGDGSRPQAEPTDPHRVMRCFDIPRKDLYLDDPWRPTCPVG